ncbi:GntR family transcriptional regulator [Streptomyces agglomeratus]|uniref:aminotransferase-like domain-containing protein n=1 Tax=Streptomyces agglomeratus TaxID=285458 RepID=UPI0008545D15|nr:PLP-dependent aminotransferase family protein [Streptomyces agglomeratus]OEJ40009.1 GntR family transcriptional regulator [Streptomyces agglomeratus]OEJ45609.1 GntR family transcriptional regulator [Streptomyces agglomeratus]OEJ59928.1 GntR family transcriptional regulator [Streptomyces agglomeratus]
MAEDFRRVADRVAAEIAAGRLRPGDRLPTQRAFARSHRIANSTAIRVYGELVRRGLAVGEVGRGTFVRAAPPSPGHALAEERTPEPETAGQAGISGSAPTTSGAPAINLELNYPVAEGQSELMAASLAGLLCPDVLEAATRPAAADGTPAAREAAASLLARGGWRPHAGQLLFAGNGRQAIAAAIASFVRPGGRLGVEALTYPLVKAVAERLGVTLVAIEADDGGLSPDALHAAHRRAPLSAVYVQPTLHNPTSVTMSEERRERLAAACEELDIGAVEDTTWAFLAPEAPAPLAARAPARTVLVDSLSKRLAPGLTTGFLAAPVSRTGRLAEALRSGAWTAARFNLEAATRWITDGTVATVEAAKRADAEDRHRLVRRRLAGFRVRTEPRAYYCWWELPAPWRTDTFVAAAAARGIAVSPGRAFAVPPYAAPDAVRIGLATPPVEVLSYALRTLAEVAEQGPPGRP